jgi:hypothetical protein
VIGPGDREQLRETAERLVASAVIIEEVEAKGITRASDAELLDSIADSLHMHAWLLEGVADRTRVARVAKRVPERFAEVLGDLDADELDQLAEFLRIAARNRRV